MFPLTRTQRLRDHQKAMNLKDPVTTARMSEKRMILESSLSYPVAGDHTTSPEWRRTMLLMPAGTPPDAVLIVNRVDYVGSAQR